MPAKCNYCDELLLMQEKNMVLHIHAITLFGSPIEWLNNKELPVSFVEDTVRNADFVSRVYYDNMALKNEQFVDELVMNETAIQYSYIASDCDDDGKRYYCITKSLIAGHSVQNVSLVNFCECCGREFPNYFYVNKEKDVVLDTDEEFKLTKEEQKLLENARSSLKNG